MLYEQNKYNKDLYCQYALTLNGCKRFMTFTELMGLSKAQEEDFKRYYKDRPDESFSPTRHKEIVERTILKVEQQAKQKSRDYVEQIKERANAVAWYLKSNAVNAGKSIEKYISRKELARLRGQKIVHKLKKTRSGEPYIELLEI